MYVIFNFRREKDDEVAAIQKTLIEVQTENSDLSRKVQNLSLKLEAQADYASIKKDLSILKVCLFNIVTTYPFHLKITS